MKISAKSKTVLRLLHKYVGFIFSIFIFFLTVTGIMLLYPESFRLNSTYLSNTYLLKKYSMLTPGDVRKLGKEDQEIILLDKSLYYKKNFIDKFNLVPINAFQIRDQNAIVVFFDNKIIHYFFKETKNVIDVSDIQENILKNKLLQVGIGKNQSLFFKTEQHHYKIINENLFTKSNDADVRWFVEKRAGKDLANLYLQIHQGKGISLHRVVTELHNGKIMGSFFSYILLLSSLSLLFLVLSSFFFGINTSKGKK